MIIEQFEIVEIIILSMHVKCKILNFNCDPGAVTVNILPAIVGAGLLLLLALPIIVLIFNPGAGSGLPLPFLVYACVCLPS